MNQQIIQKRLQKLNYQVEVCHNGKECAELFKQNPTLYDVILMDVNMPLCNGIEATDRIRSIEQENAASDLPVSHKLNRNRIPILAVSASVYDSDVGRCIAAGMDGFVNKPVNLKLLDILLQSALNREERETLIMDPSGGNRMERQEGAWFEDRLENAPQ